jgi:TPR repeat protein
MTHSIHRVKPLKSMKTSSVSPLPSGVKAPLQLLLAFACVLLAGCVSPKVSPEFIPYIGEQRGWPQSPGSIVETNYNVPIYYGWPNKPYIVLGGITVKGSHPAAVASYAKSKGADALIYCGSLTRNAGTYTAPGHATSISSGSYIGDQYSGFTTTTYSPGVSIPLTVSITFYNAVKWEDPLQARVDKLENTLGWTNGLTPAQVAEFQSALEATAEKGNATAQYLLGTMCDIGQGVKQDYIESVKWYGKAAEQGNADAQESLGLCYELGKGVPQDYAKAVKWYRRGAMQGNTDAQGSLGVCYGAGNGVPKDYVEAYEWLNLASAQGNTIAKEGLPLYEKVMTPDQIAEGQRRSAAFVPRKETPNSNSQSASPAPADFP